MESNTPLSIVESLPRLLRVNEHELEVVVTGVIGGCSKPVPVFRGLGTYEWCFLVADFPYQRRDHEPMATARAAAFSNLCADVDGIWTLKCVFSWERK